MANSRLLVMGAGPGGYAAAFLAADLGMEVTLVDAEDRLGGVCLLRGCIPSKALLHVAKLLGEAREAETWGIRFGDPQIDLAKLRQWKDQVIGKLTSGLDQLNRQRKIHRVSGRAKFIDSHTVAVAGQDPIAFDHCILATGSRPIMPANLDIDSPLVMDSTAALELEEIPDRLLIVGGGYIGLEMGTVYSALGSRVHVVEMTGGLLPGVDRDLVRILQVRLRKAFEAINLKTKLVALEKQGSRLKAVLDGEGCSGDQIYDRVLIAVGRRPNTENLGLESTQVELDDKGYIRVNAHRQTADPSIYAIGDVVGGAMLAHKASHEGRMAVEAMTGDSAPAGPAADFDSRVMPAVVFTDPEVAWCGLTEQEAQGQGRKVVVAKFPWGASGRAATVGRQDGLTKLILEPETDRILGVGLVGAGAGELIAEGVLAVEMGAVAGDLALTIHPHPTLSETLMEAAEVHAGHATHVFRRR